MSERILVLDALDSQSEAAQSLRTNLRNSLAKRSSDIDWVDVSRSALVPCIGCFDCFRTTPGECRFRKDDGNYLLAKLAGCDTVIRLSGISFGGYNSSMKLVLDRSVPFVLPFFEIVNGDTHHVPRYEKRPRAVSIGLATESGAREAELFRTIAARNALNKASPSYAATVIYCGENPENMARKIEDVLTRNDKPVDISTLERLVPAPSFVGGPAPKRALLLSASQKTLSTSSSERICRALMHHLKAAGTDCELLTLNASVFSDKGRERFLAQVEQADLMVMAFPLFVDALPSMPTRVLEMLAEYLPQNSAAPKKRFAVVVNCGFPEAHQNAPAAAICAHFAEKIGWDWAGALLVGGGEGVVCGKEITTNIAKAHPPFAKVARALALMGEALAHGVPVPDSLGALMAEAPLPIPFSWWRKLYLTMGDWGFRKTARAGGVSKKQLYARPYAPKN